jgi:hypothetical protein
MGTYLNLVNFRMFNSIEKKIDIYVNMTKTNNYFLHLINVKTSDNKIMKQLSLFLKPVQNAKMINF